METDPTPQPKPDEESNGLPPYEGEDIKNDDPEPINSDNDEDEIS